MAFAATTTSGPGASVGSLDEVEAVIQAHARPMPWAVRRTAVAATFRGRISSGWAALPAEPLAGVEQGITFGLASAPLLLKGASGTQRVPANTPWAVPSNGGWRIVFSRDTDLRLIHGDGAAMGAPATAHRPIRFRDTQERAMRAAINASTPVWVDDRWRPIPSLASLSREQIHGAGSDVRPVIPPVDHDTTAAFLVLAAWALEQHTEPTADARLGRVLEYVDTHVSDPSLSTDTVAAGCGLSRRTIQGIFADHGGLAAHIRRRRLRAALRIITADRQHFPDLDGVARATGLGSRRTLERAMRQVYGITPRQARDQILAGYRLREVESLATTRAS